MARSLYNNEGCSAKLKASFELNPVCLSFPVNAKALYSGADC